MAHALAVIPGLPTAARLAGPCISLRRARTRQGANSPRHATWSCWTGLAMAVVATGSAARITGAFFQHAPRGLTTWRISSRVARTGSFRRRAGAGPCHRVPRGRRCPGGARCGMRGRRPAQSDERAGARHRDVQTGDPTMIDTPSPLTGHGRKIVARPGICEFGSLV